MTEASPDPAPAPDVVPQLRPPRIIVVAGATAIVTAIVSVFVTALLVNIFEKKVEARNPFFRVVELGEDTTDPEIWGRNFPLQHDGYRRTVDMVRTRHGGSEAVARTPSAADPRSIQAQSRLEDDPRLKIIWAGFAFARDFREERGHAYMLEDQMFTERQLAARQPGACLHCHASVVAPYRKLGDGDAFRGFEAMNRMPYAEARTHVTHAIACIDCHAPATMALRITRPAFVEGMRTWKASQGFKDYDVNRDATRQEMRSFVCGQCHVEYYFEGKDKRLRYPWGKGLKADEILSVYDEAGFKDWEYPETGSPMLKAQHPEFEMWNQGMHARSGVSCADCHMPYKRVGAMKISDHHVRSPLLNINAACQTCHKIPESELQARVELIQDRTFRLRNLAIDAVVDLIGDLKDAKQEGVTEERLVQARIAHRRAQFLLDFVEAENSTGFHAPQEAARLLGESIDLSRKGQRQLLKK